MKYDALPPDNGSIRLLSAPRIDSDGILSCKLTPCNFYTSSFSALSYVWGPPSESQLIRVNDDTVGVRKSLYDFLHRACDLALDHIWIDALCINQTDIEERNHQVQQMTLLYQNASEVVIWLEKAVGDFRIFSCINEFGQWQGSMRSVLEAADRYVLPSASEIMNQDMAAMIMTDTRDQNPANDWLDAVEEATCRFIADMRAHTYWSRLWVVQEFCAGRRFRFLFAHGEITEKQFNTAFLWSEPSFDDDFMVASEAESSDDMRNMFISRDKFHAADKTLRSSLADLFEAHMDKKCSDSMDKIYALLGLTIDPSCLKVDYALSKAQLFVKTLQAMGETPFRIPIALSKVLDLSVQDALSTKLPLATFLYEFNLGNSATVDHWVLNGRDKQTEIAVSICSCQGCKPLSQLLHRGIQSLVCSTSLPALKLIYNQRTPQAQNGQWKKLDFIALATLVDGTLCAWMSDSDVCLLLQDSAVLMNTNIGLSAVEMNERSVFMYTYLFQFAEDHRDKSMIEHKTLVMPSAANTNSSGNHIIGTLRKEWDWDR